MESPIRFVRKHVLKITQEELAALTGVRQPTVSRWEAGILEPTQTQLTAIRNEAKRRRLKWNDALLFDRAMQRRWAA